MSLIHLIRQRIKQILIFAGMVLLVHMLKFTNYLPNWDSMYGIVAEKHLMLGFGRWFAGYSTILLHTPFDLPWVEGVVSSLLIALSITVVLDLFEIKDRLYAGIAAFLFGAFPSMAATFAYGFWAPSYMLALFLTFSGVYLNVHENARWVVSLSAVCFALGLGIYQIYYPLGMLLFLYYVACMLLRQSADVRRIKGLCARFLPSFFAGGILYWVIEKIMLKICRIHLSAYQGISSAGIMLSVGKYVRAIKSIIYHFLHFFFTGINFYSILNAVLMLLLLALVIRFVFMNKKLTLRRKILVCLLFAAVVPGSYCYYLVSEAVDYHTQMELGCYFVYLFLLLMLYYDEARIGSIFRRVAAILMIFLCLYHFQNDNNAYQQMLMSYQKTEFEMSEVLTDLDHLQTTNGKKLAMIGTFFGPFDYDDCMTNPYIHGAVPYNFMTTDFHFVQFAKYYFNRDYQQCSAEEKDEITASDAFASMPEYPADGYMQVIDDTVVVKLKQWAGVL